MSNTLLGLNYTLYSKTSVPTVSTGITIARVLKVILGPKTPDGDTDQDFIDNGEWASVGGIKYEILYTDITEKPKDIALPISSTVVRFPAEGEIVELVAGPSINMNDNASAVQLYYREPYNLWNSSHHNAFPNLVDYNNYTQAQQTGYKDTQAGAKYSNVTESINYPLGPSFPEKQDITNLQPYPGDSIISGRWGQSIRLGSTNKGIGSINPWSSQGETGDPIIIIRNGQGKRGTKETWVPTVEDINSDAASIYICSGQSIYIQDLDNYSLASYGSRTKIREDQVQKRTAVPTSTESTSAQSQSQKQLKT